MKEKLPKPTQPSQGNQPYAAEYGMFKDRNLAGMTPEQCQEMCQPTDAEPVRMQHRMAGCS